MRGHKTSSLRAAWAPSIVRRVIRRRSVQAGIVVALGLLAATSLSARAAALEEQRASWGDVRDVAVVTEPVSPGELISAAVEITELPAALIPPGALRAVPVDGRAKVALYPGEVLLPERVTLADRLGVPAGTVALTMPVVARVSLVNVGDLVDLWLVDSANFSSDRVAANVVVLALTDKDITVAVRHAQVAVATAASLRPITVTLVG